MDGTIDLGMALSAASFFVTSYFWLVKARKDRPNLQFYQVSDFRAVRRRHPDREGMKRMGIQQMDTGGVLAVNHSTRQNSIVLFDCYLTTDGGPIQGDWGYSGDDRPPWNIGPESTLGISPACFFDVPDDLELPDDWEFRIRFITASGRLFTHRFTKQAPRLRNSTQPASRAA